MQTEQFHLNFDIELRHWWFVARRRILRGLLSQIVPACPDTVVVDVGCGTGGNIGALSDTYTCVGIDPSADAVALAQSRFPKVHFLCGRAPHDLGDWAARASVVMATDVLEHVPDDFAMLSELLAAASPGTYFLLTVPADMALWSPHDESHGHYRRYDLQRFARLWQELPVSVLLASYYNTRLYPIVRLIRMLNQWRKRPSGDAGTDLKMPSALTNRLLDRVFSGELHTLTHLLQGRRRQPYRFGVSLVAILRRESGLIVPRQKPAGLQDDPYELNSQ